MEAEIFLVHVHAKRRELFGPDGEEHGGGKLPKLVSVGRFGSHNYPVVLACPGLLVQEVNNAIVPPTTNKCDIRVSNAEYV
jgi:hypothetical protein